MRIVMMGSGNVGTVLARKLHLAGHPLLQVYSRNPDHAKILAEQVGARAVWAVKDISPEADVYLLAISDNELSRIEEWNFFTTKLVAHTAGSISIDVLKNISPQYGVFYPLQSLRKELDVINGIPILIDGNTGEVKEKLSQLAKSISENVQPADDEIRKKLHLAAVVVNNFSNYLYTLAKEYCDREGVDFGLILPLIAEGAARLRDNSPALLQTGPAARKDTDTLIAQRKLLKEYPELTVIYDAFTAQLLDRKKS